MPKFLLSFIHSFIALLLRAYVALVVVTSKRVLRVNKDVESMLRAHYPVVMFFWHNRIMLLPYFTKHYNADAAAVVSAHGDGEYVTKFLQLYKLKVLRGSSRNSSMQAAKSLLQSLHSGTSIAVTPDGPRGPRYTINSNAHKVAAKMNIPVIIACYSATRSIIVNSWDRFIIPLPFSTIIFEVSRPIMLCDGDEKETASLQELMVQQANALDKELGLEI